MDSQAFIMTNASCELGHEVYTQVPILLSEYQNFNQYLSSSSICFSPVRTIYQWVPGLLSMFHATDKDLGGTIGTHTFTCRPLVLFRKNLFAQQPDKFASASVLVNWVGISLLPSKRKFIY